MQRLSFVDFISKHVANQGETRVVLAGFCPLSGCVMLPLPVLCSHCIKMKICYLSAFRTFSFKACIFLQDEVLFNFESLGVSANSGP
jgi:hypothetical protein